MPKPETRRRCPRCGNYAKREFPKTRRSYRRKDGVLVRKEYELSYCHVCLRRQRNKAQKRRPTPKKTKEQIRRNNALPSSKEARRRYNRSKKGKAVARRAKVRARRKALRLLTAPIPTIVLKPLVEQLLKTRDKTQLAAETGTSPRTIYAIVNNRRRSTTLEVVDALSLAGTFTTEEIYNRTREWALLTQDPWPDGYGRGAKPRLRLDRDLPEI